MTPKAKAILRPLYIWTFIEALIFWYAIEKLLWSSVGITADQIVILGIIAQSAQVFIEVPSSIIADRWSRRKSLMLSSTFMLVAIIIVLSVQSFYWLAVMCLVWAFYFAFQSGTVNAYVYDLLKEQGEQSQYRKAMSRFNTFQLSGLLISSLAASVLIEWGNFFTPYWVTLVPTTIAIILLWRMHDPAFERTDQSTGTALHHVRSALRNISGKKWLSIIFVALAFVTAGRFVWYEYYQLYAIQQQIAPILFGLLLAVVHIGNLLGSEFAHRVKSPHTVLSVSFAALIISTASLAFVSGSAAIIIFLVVCFFGSQACAIILDESLQHETSSELRATTLSLAGLGSRIIFGVSAGAIILLGTTPKMIALAALVTFLFIVMYVPVRKHLVSAEQRQLSLS